MNTLIFLITHSFSGFYRNLSCRIWLNKWILQKLNKLENAQLCFNFLWINDISIFKIKAQYNCILLCFYDHLKNILEDISALIVWKTNLFAIVFCVVLQWNPLGSQTDLFAKLLLFTHRIFLVVRNKITIFKEKPFLWLVFYWTTIII